MTSFKFANIMYRLWSLARAGRQAYGFKHIPIIVIIAYCCNMAFFNTKHIGKFHYSYTFMCIFFQHFKRKY